MELLVLLALVFMGLSVLIRRRGSTSRAPAAVVIQNIADPAVAHRTLVENADHFSDRPVPPFLLALEKSHGGQRAAGLNNLPYGPLWRALRCNLTAETLHPSRLGHMAPLHREAIQGLVAALGKQLPVVAVREHIFAAVFSVAVRLCFGDDVDEDHLHAMRCGIQEIQRTAVGDARASPGTVLAKLAQWRSLRRILALHARNGELYLRLVAARRESRSRRPCDGRRPYIDSLIDLRVPDDNGGRRPVRDGELVNLVLEFLGGGSGGVSSCLEWTLAHLVNDQEVQKKLRHEVDGAGEAVVSSSGRGLINGMPYLNAVVLESLRMHPPVLSIMRHVHADAAGILGVNEGTTTSDLIVQFPTGGIGRDSKMWTDPDVFRPERFLPGGEAEDVGPLPGPKEIRMMPFGAGHRFCPGAGLAMMNIKCFLAALVREFEWAAPPMEMEGGASVDLTELITFIKVMKKPLSAHLTRRT